MNTKKLLVFTFPSIIIFILCMIIFFSFINCGLCLFNKALFICLGIIIPIMFLLQGIICGITNTNVYISFLLSIVSSFYIITIYTDLTFKFMIRTAIINSIQGYSAYLVAIFIKKKHNLKCADRKR